MVTIDWNQAAGNAAKTSYTAETVSGFNWTLAWSYKIQEHHQEKIYGGLQPITSNGHILLASLGRFGDGKLYCFTHSLTGPTLEWTADVGAPVMATPCADGTYCYLVDSWGRSHRFRLTDGARVAPWTTPVQITRRQKCVRSHLLLADSKIMFGAEDGYMYAISMVTGQVLWEYSTGQQIMQGAAWSNITGTPRTVVGTMSNHVLSFHSGTGVLLQDSGAKEGGGFRDFWPVILEAYQKVWIAPMVRYPYWEPARPPAFEFPYRGIVADIHIATAQDAALAAYVANPNQYVKGAYILDLATLAENPTDQIIHWTQFMVHGGSHPAPCLESNGYLVVPIAEPSDRTPVFGRSSGGYGGNAGWGALNYSTKKVVYDLYDPTPGFPADGHVRSGYGNRDENPVPTGCANCIAIAHPEETNAAITAVWDGSLFHPFGPGGSHEILCNSEAPNGQRLVISGDMGIHHCQPNTIVVYRTA